MTAGSGRYSSLLVFASGLLLLGVGWAVAHAGVVPYVGFLVAMLGPDVFLAGWVAISLCIASILVSNKIAKAALAIGLSIVFGLNTRLPYLLADIGQGAAEHTTVTSRLRGETGQPLHVAADTPVLSARLDPSASAHPGCVGDGCIATTGFGMPITWLETDYWHEKVLDAALRSGFTEAHPGEIAPTLTARQFQDGYRAVVQMSLVDTNGTVVARYEGRYRNGWPFETPDSVDKEHRPVARASEYLWHGNLLNGLATAVVPGSTPYPVSAFLKASTALAHAQGTTGRSEAGNESSSVNVALEVLAQQTYDPIRVIDADSSAGPSKWTALTWDPSREALCKTMLMPEDASDHRMGAWYLFVNDATHRKKARIAGSTLCDADAIWFEDYVGERGRVVLTKFSAQGDFQYRISFEKPPEPGGFAGGIMQPTFRAENGYLYFEWWSMSQAGQNERVARSMQVRIKEPRPSVAANGASASSRK